MEGHPEYVDYERVYNGRYAILKKAFENSNVQKDADY